VPWLALVLTLAAGLRLAHVLALRDTPWFDHLVVDPGYYDQWAQRLAAGDWLGERAFYMDPLYPYALAGLYRLFGRDLLLVRLVQVVLGVGSCWLVASIGTRVGGRRIGLVAALLFALYKPDIFHAAEIEKTSLSVFLAAAGLAAFLSSHRLLSGLAFGLATLTRANLLFVAPAGALVLAMERPRRIIAPALFLAGFALALVPVTWRNHRVSGDFVLTTTQGGQNFYMGNNRDNLSGSYGTLPFLRMNPAFEEEDFRAEAERRTGRALDARATSRFWYGEALRFIRDYRVTAASLFERKLALVWNDYEISDNQDQYLLARDSWVMRLPLPGFGLVLVLAAVGVAATIARNAPVRILTAFALLYATSVAAFFVFSRYRIQLVPALAPLAALGLQELRTSLEGRAVRPLVRDAVIVLAVAAFTFRTIPPFYRDHPQVNAMRLHKLADVYLLAHDPEHAVAVLVEALRQCPERCPSERDAFIDLMIDRGRGPEGVAFLRELANIHSHGGDTAPRDR
jgi:4-amino-4-deoxy-L-arabinose transferase-like glycosyltransferase